MANKVTKYLKDYTPTDYLVDTIDLTFIINDNKTVQVKSVSHYSKHPKSIGNTLNLDGDCELIKIALNDCDLQLNKDYIIADKQLIISNLPDKFVLDVTTLLYPWDNKSCMGLYVSNNNLITQCEPEGFRKITYYQDRPDILAIFTTTIIANGTKYNSLLSNGNRIFEDTQLSNQDKIDSQCKIIKWQDNFKKPCYLFALVVGNFATLRDVFITKSNQVVNLEIYANQNSISSCTHAMNSLKRAMKWDEDYFNLEYDLDLYMVVACDDFNMGAMENKGLNLFNTKYILADKNTATDADFMNVEEVIAHEYFHNWTGNRVTCRDWFQLSLKEGLTVFREYEFSAQLHNRSIKLIEEVKALRQRQFVEDSGPLAHSVRPDSYIEIDNFYTTTVYDKGAQVVRMYQTILGEEGFKNGLALYLTRHDGQAATCEDFNQAMMDSNNIDLSQLMLWYSQAGTPHIDVITDYDQDEFKLTFIQNLHDTPNQTNKKPMLIPVNVGFISLDGTNLSNIKPISGRYIQDKSNNLILLLDKTTNVFIFKQIGQQPIASILRNFSAPVILHTNYTEDQLLHLVSYDNDNFNRFESLQIIIKTKIIQLYQRILNKQNNELVNNDKFWKICGKLLNDTNLSPGFRAILFTIPSFSEILNHLSDVNPQILSLAIHDFTQEMGNNLFDSWMELYNVHLSLSSEYDFNDFETRSLKNTALFFILKGLSAKLDNPKSLQLIETITLGQYRNAQNMTDSFFVLFAIKDLDVNVRELVLNEFYNKWQGNELVINKWFAVWASSSLISTDKLNKLIMDKAFIATNPNKIYALLNTFTQNGAKFNSEEGYSFIADKIISIDKFNPSVASSLTKSFAQVGKLSASYKILAKSSLNIILNQPSISSAVYESASKIVAGMKI